MTSDVKKKHLIFLTLLCLTLVVSVAFNFLKGATLPDAAWQMLADIRPAEIALFAGLWYSAVTGDASHPSLTTLKLTEEKN